MPGSETTSSDSGDCVEEDGVHRKERERERKERERESKEVEVKNGMMPAAIMWPDKGVTQAILDKHFNILLFEAGSQQVDQKTWGLEAYKGYTDYS